MSLARQCRFPLSFPRAACLLLAAFLLLPLPAAATIHYQVSLADRAEHLFDITMTVPDVQGELVLQMPAWNALYQIRDFAHRVQQVRARQIGSGARELAVRKRDKLTWRVAGQGTVEIRYRVHWNEPGAFSSQLNSDHAFLNPAMVFFYVPARRDEDVRVTFTNLPRGWRAAAALREEAPAVFTAADYDALADAPIELGRFEDFRFTVNGARIRVVVHGPFDRAGLEATLRRIVAYQTALMGETPFEEFLFLYHFGQGGGGGMEHANSTAIFQGEKANPAAISAHEFFHLWNVKRIRPASLEPVDYTREQWTRALWFAEGVTSTYTDYTLLRSGLITTSAFYARLAGQVGQLESRPAREWKSAEEASLDAWHEKYPLYARPEFSISYYNKGYLLGVLLDILLRDASDNRTSLDHLLRYFNREYARRGRFYDDSVGIRAAVESVLGEAAAHARPGVAEFFARYVAGTDPLPLAEFLARAGLRLRRQGEGFVVDELPGASPRQRRIREGLLRGTTDAAAHAAGAP